MRIEQEDLMKTIEAISETDYFDGSTTIQEIAEYYYGQGEVADIIGAVHIAVGEALQARKLWYYTGYIYPTEDAYDAAVDENDE